MEKAKIKNFRDLDIWTKGVQIVKDVYVSTETLPKEEKYGLISQMRRAAVSVPANIAEGFNRFHNKEYKQFLYVALGSCAELETHIEIASELGYIGVDNKKAILSEIEHESRMIRNLIKKLD